MPALSIVLSWTAIFSRHALLLAVSNVIMSLFAAAAIPTSSSSCIWLSLPRPAACLYADHCLHFKPLAAAASAAGWTCDIQLCVQAMRKQSFLRLSQMIPLISSHPQMWPHLM